MIRPAELRAALVDALREGELDFFLTDQARQEDRALVAELLAAADDQVAGVAIAHGFFEEDFETLIAAWSAKTFSRDPTDRR